MFDPTREPCPFHGYLPIGEILAATLGTTAAASAGSAATVSGIGLTAGTISALGTGVATAGGLAALQATQAAEKNASLKRAQEAQAKAVALQSQQITEQQAVQRNQMTNRANLLQSRLRVAAGESGLGLGGTYQALARQTDYDAAMNQRISAINAKNAILNVRSGGRANIAQLQGQMDNPALAGIMGGVQGFGLGLGLANGIGGIAQGFAGATNVATPVSSSIGEGISNQAAVGSNIEPLNTSLMF